MNAAKNAAKNDAPYDVIVLGLGAMGSAALYQIAKRGALVLGIDQFFPPHSFGSSHGDTRLTRQAIGEGEAYTPLALRSYELWQQIQTECGDHSLLTETGGLILSVPHASGLHKTADFIGDTRKSAQKYGIAHENLSALQIADRFPPFRLRGDETGYFEYGAGFLRPECCVAAHLALAQKNGARVHVGETVQDFSQDAGGTILVQTNKAAYRAEKLIITAGPWISNFLPEPVRENIAVYRQVLYWFDVAENYWGYAPERFPVFIWDLGGGESIYGFPAIDGKNGGLKIAHEQYQESTDPASVNRTVSRSETDAMYANFVAPYLRGVGEMCLKSSVCLYTVTPDGDFLLDTHPDTPNVFIASPCSGHGFKHCPAIGEILAQLSLTGKTDWDISAFSRARF